MSSLVYNLSVIFLLLGLVLMVYYTTKIQYQKETVITTKDPDNIYNSYVYQERPATLFKNMFNNLGPWIGRTVNPIDEEINENDMRVREKTQSFLLFY